MSRPLTGTSYALLGLLAIRPWTTYELAAQMDRGLHRFWPRARSKVFEEPKNLVAHGLARATKEKTGKRAATVYTITPKGRRAMAAWLSEPGAAPVLEWEQLLQVFFSPSGSRKDLLATLGAVAAWAEEEKRHHRDRARAILDGTSPFPERMAVNSLVGAFLADFVEIVGAWAERSAAMVEGWPDDLSAATPDFETIERVAAGDFRRPART